MEGKGKRKVSETTKLMKNKLENAHTATSRITTEKVKLTVRPGSLPAAASKILVLVYVFLFLGPTYSWLSSSGIDPTWQLECRGLNLGGWQARDAPSLLYQLSSPMI